MSQDFIRLLNDTGRSWSIARTTDGRSRPMFFVGIFGADATLIAYEIGHDLDDCVVRRDHGRARAGCSDTTHD
jgi:hypothetical protein